MCGHNPLARAFLSETLDGDPDQLLMVELSTGDIPLMRKPVMELSFGSLPWDMTDTADACKRQFFCRARKATREWLVVALGSNDKAKPGAYWFLNPCHEGVLQDGLVVTCHIGSWRLGSIP